MALVPWNNPLVGTAFMLRARRGNLLLNVSLYIIILVMGLMGWQYYVTLIPNFKANPHKIFLLILFGGQCFVSGLLMLGQAGGSLKNEVMNKTLDFQRIAAVGPWDILLGKLLGIPVMSYLLAIAAIPIGVFTLLNGVPGVGLVELLLSWLQLLTFLFLLGSCAIQNTLQITTAKGTGAAPGFGIFMAVVGLLTYSSFASGDALSYLHDPRRSSIGALFSPLTAYAGFSAEDPWLARFYWFSWSIPCLVLTPLSHIVAAWFFLTIMARRLECVDATPLGKIRGYLCILLVDLVLAGLLGSCHSSYLVLGGAGQSLQQLVGMFLLFHVAVSIIYFVTLTPRADWIMTWIWRFRKQHEFVRDSLLEDRAPNTLALPVNLLCATLGVGLMCLIIPDSFTDPDFLLDACLTAAATIVFLGLLFQAFQLISRKYAAAYFIMVLLFFLLAPVMIGAILSQPRMKEYNDLGQFLVYATPVSQVFRWGMTDSDRAIFQVSPYPLIAAYAVFSVFLWMFTWKWIRVRTNRVQKLKKLLHATDVAVQAPQEPDKPVDEVK